MTCQLEMLSSLDSVPAVEWDALAGVHPFTRYRFLQLLQDTACAAPQNGWTPLYIVLREQGVLCGGVAVYLKTDSRGEFVFDQAWAEAYARHGLDYYPKAVVSVPFTPVTGPRLLAREEHHKRLLIDALLGLAQQMKLSSIHVLFPDPADCQLLTDAGFMLREGVQFHWRNMAYRSFEEFVATFSQEKRKKLRQDRKKVEAQGISFAWLEGSSLDEEALAFFYQCYQNTYDRHWGRPYLSLEFFRQLHRDCPDLMLLVQARQAGRPLACALNVKGPGVLYGRYWGTQTFVPGLHFETCYAQSIAYCIAHGYDVFEGGAQGEHKMARGLLPVKTCSAHWVADRQFAEAIERFLEREAGALDNYVDALGQSSPFRRNIPR